MLFVYFIEHVICSSQYTKNLTNQGFLSQNQEIHVTNLSIAYFLLSIYIEHKYDINLKKFWFRQEIRIE